MGFSLKEHIISQYEEEWGVAREVFTQDDINNIKTLTEDELRSNRNYMCLLMSKDMNYIYDASDDIKDDRDLIIDLIKNTAYVGISLKYLSNRLREDEEIVKSLIRRNSYNYKYACEKHHNDKKITKMIAYNKHLYKYIGNDLLEDEDFMFELYTYNKNIKRYAKMEFNEEFILKQLEKQPKKVQNIEKKFFKSKEFMDSLMVNERAVKALLEYPTKYNDNSIINNKDIIRYIENNHLKVLYDIPEKNKKDPAYIVALESRSSKKYIDFIENEIYIKK